MYTAQREGRLKRKKKKKRFAYVPANLAHESPSSSPDLAALTFIASRTNPDISTILSCHLKQRMPDTPTPRSQALTRCAGSAAMRDFLEQGSSTYEPAGDVGFLKGLVRDANASVRRAVEDMVRPAALLVFLKVFIGSSIAAQAPLFE